MIVCQVMSYDSHTNNVMAVGFQCDGNWMYSGSEDGTVKIWDLRSFVLVFLSTFLLSSYYIFFPVVGVWCQIWTYMLR